MTPIDYLAAVRRVLDHLEQTQMPAVDRAADLIVEALRRRGAVYCAGIGHGNEGDFIDRAGGLAAVKKFQGECRSGDVVMIGSVSGRNVNPVETALSCRAKGAATIGLTSMEYTRQVASLHPSGSRLFEAVDVAIDNGAPYGDAAVEVAGYDHALLPVSGVAFTVIGHMVFGRVMEKMAEAGTPATVFMSANRAGGEEAYQRSLARFKEKGY